MRYRTPAVARIYASNLLDHIRITMEQSVTGRPVDGAIGKPGGRLVVLVGHDTNIVAVAGALGIDWIADGRADDSPPGGALIFDSGAHSPASTSCASHSPPRLSSRCVNRSRSHPPIHLPKRRFLSPAAAAPISPAPGTASPRPCARPPIPRLSPRCHNAVKTRQAPGVHVRLDPDFAVRNSLRATALLFSASREL